jgi:hypothetical protein
MEGWKIPKVSIAFGPSKPSKSGDGERCSRPWMRIGPTSLELIGEPHELLERLGLLLMGFHEVSTKLLVNLNLGFPDLATTPTPPGKINSPARRPTMSFLPSIATVSRLYYLFVFSILTI